MMTSGKGKKGIFVILGEHFMEVASYILWDGSPSACDTEQGLEEGVDSYPEMVKERRGEEI